jgi:hypothetical protein
VEAEGSINLEDLDALISSSEPVEADTLSLKGQHEDLSVLVDVKPTSEPAPAEKSEAEELNPTFLNPKETTASV